MPSTLVQGQTYKFRLQAATKDGVVWDLSAGAIAAPAAEVLLEGVV